MRTFGLEGGPEEPTNRKADRALRSDALECARQEAERLHGPLERAPFMVTGNGSSFLAKNSRQHTKGAYAHVRIDYRTHTRLRLRASSRPSSRKRCTGTCTTTLAPRAPHWRASLSGTTPFGRTGRSFPSTAAIR